jgi:hypothetical protein
VGVVPGDLNFDGVVDQSELNGVLAAYWPSSPWLFMTNAEKLPDGRFQFALTNANTWDFHVLVSTNLANWETLPGLAVPVYQFFDSQAASNAPRRFYRLQYP